ncbi:MAG: hypothetical protein ACLTDT_13850 [Clostridium sp.]
MNEFLDIFMEAGVDTLKLIPFLFLTYILMEWLEHRTGSHTQAAILRAGKAGPVFGGILGIVPQCGFFGSSIKSVFRWFDYGGRFGGCLFCLLLTKCFRFLFLRQYLHGQSLRFWRLKW